MKKTKTGLGKLMYGLLFLVAVPIMLIYWVKYTEQIVSYPSIQSQSIGLVTSIAGGLLMLWGMIALMKYGEGLPMNAYPPKKFVREGPYRLFRHPIYTGFGILSIGISILTGSAAGLWLVSPITILGMTALVWGYEKINLEVRFPGKKIHTFFGIAERKPDSPNLRDRLSAIFLLFFVLFVGNYVIGYLEGVTLPLFGKPWKIHSFFEAGPFYFFSLLFILGAPLLSLQKQQLRAWTSSGLIALALSIYISLLWPGLGAQYFHSDFSSTNGQESLSFVLQGVPLFLILISLKTYNRRFKRLALFFWAIALFLCLYQLSNSNSSVLHALIGIILYFIGSKYFQIWSFLKNLAEKIANSWKEWIFGPVRVINHGFYVGFGCFSGILLSGWLAGKAYAWAILIFVIIVMVFSALWAQLIEGSEKLKRPFGYYGALVGVIFAGPIIWGMGYNIWVILGIVSVMMTWAQAIGRLRCLINGCCHGSPITNENIGIRYFHHRSRVCGISNLKGELLHPTQLYAIIWLFFIGFILYALWKNNFPYSFILGLYLILTGIGRFVEEAYRGEVQTPILNRLRLYQWTAIASVAIGIIMTLIPVPLEALYPEIGWETILAALIGGLFTFFAMGVDFPRSNARFSRLV